MYKSLGVTAEAFVFVLWWLRYGSQICSMKKMSINEFLSIIRDTETSHLTFTIRFVRSSKKRKGTLASIAKARYGGPKRYTDSGEKTKNKFNRTSAGTPNWLHTEKGTLPLTDTERNKYFTPLISHIIGYNDYTIIH